MKFALSVLDTSPVASGEGPADAIDASVRLAQQAERAGFSRVWYAEHHNMPRIASSATSVIIAHVGAMTSTIRLGAGGVMLPNHAPLVIAEQFGTLESIHPGRIDLGVGRAAGSDVATMRALRRTPAANDRFRQDVRELRGYLGDQSFVPDVQAVPGQGTRVPLYILGSSLYGAKVAADLGLPYAFASHFAPTHLLDALAIYRSEFKASEELSQPYVMVGLNVVGADSAEEAEAIGQHNRREFVHGTIGKGQNLSDAQADEALSRGVGDQYESLFRYTAVGTTDEVGEQLAQFQQLTGADEIITSHLAPTIEQRLTSVSVAAAAAGLVAPVH